MSRTPSWDEATLLGLAEVAQRAGAAILRIYQDPAAARPLAPKADHSPLTAADLAADAVIREQLGRRFPGLAVLSEESQPPQGAGVAALQPGYFLVDPLDGTREFLARNGEFTVNIAWVQRGRARAGVVLAPVPGECFFGAEGAGAWRLDAQGQRRIRVAAAPATGAPLRVLASRSHASAAQQALLARQPSPLHSVAAGSSLKFCRVAEGAADLYPRLSPTMAWDTAAGQAVLEAAGGVVLCADGCTLAVPDDPCAGPNPDFMAARDAALALQAWRLAG